MTLMVSEEEWPSWLRKKRAASMIVRDRALMGIMGRSNWSPRALCEAMEESDLPQEVRRDLVLCVAITQHEVAEAMVDRIAMEGS